MMPAKRPQFQVPVLRDVQLDSRPIAKRPLAWSCDGELAVAADDSVCILVPEFPDPTAVDSDGAGSGVEGGGSEAEEAEEASESEDPDLRDLRPAFLRRRVHTRSRTQFSEGRLRIPVSFPRLHPKLNRELFDATGTPFPSYQGVRQAAGIDADDGDLGISSEDSEAGSEDSDFDPAGLDHVWGVGTGVIASSNSGLNHVVSLAWSPNGLGPLRRPVLAVLTSAGDMAVYGDGTTVTRASGAIGAFRGADGVLRQRSLSSWRILWGIGGRTPIPGQKADTADCIRGFAWSTETGAGGALLVYITDILEVVVVSVRCLPPSTPVAEDAGTSRKGKGRENDTEAANRGDKKKAAWIVREVLRFKADSPHPATSVWDPDYIPQGTSFGLRLSPWLLSEGSRSCVISYINRDYVGFRRITVRESSTTSGESPDNRVEVDNTDLHGECVCLSADGFVEFEDAIWTKGESKLVRGLISTGFAVKPFQVILAGPGSNSRPGAHKSHHCDAELSGSHTHNRGTNPIQDLIIHPPNKAKPTPIPAYTLVRLSATSTNDGWYESNAAESLNDPSLRPKWATDLSRRLDISVPADLHMRDDSGDDDSDDPDRDEADMGEGDGLGLVSEDNESESEVPQGAEIHPHRFRLYGIAASPGGGTSAILMSAFGTQHPDRCNWSTLRSTVMFDYKSRPALPQDTAPTTRLLPIRPLTTEGRMWEWMYGEGPEVAGVTPGYENTSGDWDADAEAVNKRAKMRELFREARQQQRCDLCQETMETRGPGSRKTVCKTGHFFTTCGSSGLAIQGPGISRTCGVCGGRTLTMDALIKKAPQLREKITENSMRHVCGSCGGKFVD